MRNSAPLLFAALLLACSGEDEPKGAGDGTSAAGKAGAAGTGSLVVGGSAGRAGDAGSAGAGGKAGGGQGGAAGFTVDLQPSKSVCGNGKLEPGERCDGTEGTTSDITCADLLGDPAATGTPTCDRCFPSHLGCVSCLDGRKNGAETDIDCGGTSGCTPCSLGKSCAADADCAATLGCYGGVCNDVSVSVLGSGVSEVAVGVGRAIPLSVRSSLPLPPGTTATIDAGANVSLESTSPLDVTRLVVRIPPGAAIKGTVALGGHPFELALTPPNSAGGVSKLQSTAFSGRLCDTGAPLVLETVPSGPTPGMEVPVGRNVCFRVDLTDFVQYPWNASLGGTVLFSGPPLSQKHIDLSYPLPAVYPLWDARTGNTTVDLAIRFGTGAVSSLLVPQRLVLSPKTYRKGATGVGTTSSPADITLTTAALGGPYVSRTIIQLSGAHEIPAAGLIVPDNLVLVGIDDDASLVANKTGATVTLGNNSELRRLSVVGSAPAGTMPESPCIAVTGKGAALRGVAVRGCATGIQLKKDATAVMFGSGANDIQDVRDAIVGDGGATFTGATLGLSTSASKGPLTGVRGFEGGNVSLLRPKIEGFDVGVLLGDGATGELFDAVVASKGSAVQARTNAKLALVGGRLGASGTLSIGLAAETGALVDARGIAIEDASSGGVAVSGGTVNLTASVLRRCGGANTSAMFAAQGGSLRANGLRIEQPGQVGIFALKDAKSVSLTGTVVEATTFRSVWIFGGQATLRTVQLIDPVTTGLAYGDPAEPIDVRDLDIVRHFPCTDGSELVFADRKPGGVAERLSFHALVAGAGKVVSSVPDGPVCGRQLFDPNGGWYLRTNGDQQQVCF